MEKFHVGAKCSLSSILLIFSEAGKGHSHWHHNVKCDGDLSSDQNKEIGSLTPQEALAWEFLTKSVKQQLLPTITKLWQQSDIRMLWLNCFNIIQTSYEYKFLQWKKQKHDAQTESFDRRNKSQLLSVENRVRKRCIPFCFQPRSRSLKVP